MSVATTATDRNSNRYAPLPRRLEEEPLDERVPLPLVGDGQPLLRVVLVDEVEEDRAGLPDDEVAVLVVDEGGDAAVRVQLRVRGRRLLVLGKVEVDGLVGEPELVEQERDLPESRVGGDDERRYGDGREESSTDQPLEPILWV